MRPMEHAAAHELLADLALEPAMLARLDTSAELADLRHHIASCDVCRVDLAGWQATLAAIDDTVAAAAGGPGRLAELATESPISPPASLRAAVERIPARAGTPGDRGPVLLPVAGTSRVGTIGWRRALALVAAVTVLVAGGAFVRDQAARLDAARAETQALEGVTAGLDRVLSDPGHRAVALVGADGTARGTVSWSSHDIVVMSTALAQPPSGEVYRCWVEQGGIRSPVGEMWFAGGLAYWTGSLDGWATISLDGGGRLGVSLEPAAGGTGGVPALVADLSG